jgi:hypothetical protein
VSLLFDGRLSRDQQRCECGGQVRDLYTDTPVDKETTGRATQEAQRAAQDRDEAEPTPPAYVATLRLVARSLTLLLSRWSLALLVLCAVAVTIAYSSNPTTHIKIGGGYDAPYLNTYDLAYIDNWAGGFGDIVHFKTAAPQETNSNQEINGLSDTSGTAGAATEPNPTKPANRSKYGPEPVLEDYRWTREHPVLVLPGVGSAAALDLRAAASPVYSGGQTIRVVSNGQELTSFLLRPGIVSLNHIDLGNSYRGNYTVEMYVTPNGSANPKVKAPANGFKLYDVWVTPRSQGLLPPPDIAVALGLVALGLYWILAFLGLPKPYAFLASALLLGLLSVTLAVWRLELTIFVWRLVFLFAVAAVSLLLLDWLVPRVLRRAGVVIPPWATRALLALFVVGLVLRGGGVLYPQMIVIDARAHLVEIWRVTQGQLLGQYTNHALSLAPGQWNSSIVIPYSTISYFLLAPFALLPIDIHVSINMVNVLLDAGRVFIIFALARVMGLRGGTWGALAAAGLYLVLPPTWLLNSWGNWPTTISLWLASLYIALALFLLPRLGSRRVWLGLTALLTLTMMVYTVTAVFMVLLVGLWATLLVLFEGRRDAVIKRNGLRLLASVPAAVLASTALYYWQFVPDLATSITTAGHTLANGAGLGVDYSFNQYIAAYSGRLFVGYGVGFLLVAGLVPYAPALLARLRTLARLRHPPSHESTDNTPETERSAQIPGFFASEFSPARWLVAAWLAVFALFSLAGWKIDMVDKQVWFIVPLACVLGGQVLVLAWEQARPTGRRMDMPTIVRYGARLAVGAATGWLAYSAGTLWLYRIFIKGH